jgi:hypothetical protein
LFKHNNPFVVVIAKAPGQNRSDPMPIRKPLALAQTAKHRKCHERNCRILGAIQRKSLTWRRAG